MTLPEDFTKAVRVWYEKNGDIPLTKANGRTELMAIYQKLVPGKSTQQANRTVGTAIQNIRPVIAPEKTNKKGLKKREIGQLSSRHPDEKKKVNAINNAIKKAKLADQNRAEILANPLISTQLLTDDQLKSKVETILGTSFVELGDVMLKDAVKSGGYSVYVGMTR